MDLKSLLGDAYKEEITLEEINELLKDKELIDASTIEENYVDKTVWDKAKRQADSAAHDAAEWKRKYRAQVSDEEQRKLEIEEANKQRDAEFEQLKRESTISKYEKQYLAQGYDDKLANKTATALYENDMDSVFKLQASFIEQTKKDVEKAKLNNTPTPPSQNEDGTQGKKDISQMSLDEMQNAYSEDPSAFEK